jgi:uncharacterized protein HemY
MHSLGKLIILIGILLVIAGVIIYFAGNKFSWFGHLPGDIRIERENFRFYFPITTMIIISVVITVIMAIIRKFFG